MVALTDLEREAARVLYEDMRHRRLEVVLIGGSKVVVSRNAEWYQDFCRQYARPRKRYPKVRTIIKRCHTLRTLERIIDGTAAESVYIDRLRPFLEGAIHG